MNYVAYEICPVRFFNNRVIPCHIEAALEFGIFKVVDSSTLVCGSGNCREFVDSHANLGFAEELAHDMNNVEPLDYGVYRHGC